MVLFAKVVHSTLALLPFFVFIEKRLGQHCIGLHNYNNVPNLPMWPVMSGTYTLNEEDKVVGCIRTSHKRW